MEKHNCEYCNKEMVRQATAFIKCPDKSCKGSHFGIVSSDIKENVRGVAHLLKKKV